MPRRPAMADDEKGTHSSMFHAAIKLIFVL
jgi:hypothetical protein